MAKGNAHELYEALLHRQNVTRAEAMGIADSYISNGTVADWQIKRYTNALAAEKVAFDEWMSELEARYPSLNF